MKFRKRCKKTLLFILTLVTSASPIFNIFLYKNLTSYAEISEGDPTDNVTYESETHYVRSSRLLNDWCPDAPNENVSVICGVVSTATVKPDKRFTDKYGEPLWEGDNRPIEGVTVAVYEKNQISPTGHIGGKLTHLFSSTETNIDGRFAVTTRKYGPPDGMVYVAFLCNGTVKNLIEVESYQDFVTADVQMICDSSIEKDHKYVMPPVPLDYSVRGGSYACDRNISDEAVTYTNTENTKRYDLPEGTEITIPPTIPIGMGNVQQPAVNNHVKEENYDIRHVQNSFAIEGINLSVLGLNMTLDILNFQSKGGLRERDCILELDPSAEPAKYITGMGDMNSTAEYFCNKTIDGEPGKGSKYLMKEGGLEDYVTRNWLRHIPKGDEIAYRRLDVRMNLTNYIADPLAGSRATNKLFGGYTGSSDNYIRGYRQKEAEAELTLPYCQNFKDCNQAVARVTYSERNLQTCGGAKNMMDKYTTEDLYASAFAADTLYNPFCVDPQYTFTTEDDEGETVKLMEPIRLCEIQPFDSTCTVGIDCEPDPITGCEYKLGKEYFSAENYLYNPPTTIGGEGGSPNDSKPTTENREDPNFADRSAAGNTTATGSTIAIPKANKMGAAGSLTNPDDFIGEGTRRLMDLYDNAYFIKYPEAEEQYYKDELIKGPKVKNLSLIRAVEVGSNMHSHCAVSNNYSDPNETVDKTDEEILKTRTIAEVIGAFEPEKKEQYTVVKGRGLDNFSFKADQDFTGNDMHANSENAATAQWYTSEGILREITLGTRTSGIKIHNIPEFLNPGVGNFQLFDDIIVSASGEEKPTYSALVNAAEDKLLGRDIIDSVWSLIGGDTKMHQEEDGVFRADIKQLALITLKSIAGGSDEKSFAHRSAITGFTIPRDTYELKYTVTEQNFNDLFRLPKPTDDIYWLDKEDWDLEMDDPSENECYPWDVLDVGMNEKCNTFKDGLISVNPADKNEVSRTCRVNLCKKATASIPCTCHYKVQQDATTGEWYGSNTGFDCSPGVDEDYDTAKERVNYNFTTEDCDRIPEETAGGGGRLTCAENQYTCLPFDTATPEGISPGGRAEFNFIDQIKEYEDDIKVCVYDHAYKGRVENLIREEPDCPGTVSVDEFLVPEDVSPTKTTNIPLCNMGKAGPLICNAELEIGDAAFRLKQTNPIRISEKNKGLAENDSNLAAEIEGTDENGGLSYNATDEPTNVMKFKQKNMAPVSMEGSKFYENFRMSPMPKELDRGVVSNTDFLTTNDPYAKSTYTEAEDGGDDVDEEQVVGRYTYGKEIESPGTAMATRIARIVSTGQFPKNVALHEIHYHCPNMGVDLPGYKNFISYNTGMKDIYADPDQDNELGWACRVYEIPQGEPNLSGRGACGISSCGDTIEDLSPTFINVINTAANATNVPAALIIAAMYGEGAFMDQYMPYWQDDDYVKMVSLPYYGRLSYLGTYGFKGPLQGDDLTWSAVGPFQFIKKWADATLREIPDSTIPNACELLNGIQAGRCQQYRSCVGAAIPAGEPGAEEDAPKHSCKEFFTPSRMNLLDAAVMAGKSLQLLDGDEVKNCGSYQPGDYITALNRYAGGEYSAGALTNLSKMSSVCN